MANRWTMSSHPMGRLLRNNVDRAFDDAFGELFNDRYSPWGRIAARERRFPAVNVWEGSESLYVEAEVPGLKLEDLDIFVHGDELTIRGEREHDEQEGVTYHRRERGTGSFSSSVRLPVEIDVDRVEAQLESGVLTITLPKAASARPRKIEVKARKS